MAVEDLISGQVPCRSFASPQCSARLSAEAPKNSALVYRLPGYKIVLSSDPKDSKSLRGTAPENTSHPSMEAAAGADQTSSSSCSSNRLRYINPTLCRPSKKLRSAGWKPLTAATTPLRRTAPWEPVSRLQEPAQMPDEPLRLREPWLLSLLSVWQSFVA